MKISRKPPDSDPVLVETNPKDKMFTWYAQTPRPLGQVHLHGVRQWVSDDGLTFNNAEDVKSYFVRRAADRPKELEPGTYTAPVYSVLQPSMGTIVITLRNGAEIIIRNKE